MSTGLVSPKVWFAPEWPPGSVISPDRSWRPPSCLGAGRLVLRVSSRQPPLSRLTTVLCGRLAVETGQRCSESRPRSLTESDTLGIPTGVSEAGRWAPSSDLWPRTWRCREGSGHLPAACSLRAHCWACLLPVLWCRALGRREPHPSPGALQAVQLPGGDVMPRGRRAPSKALASWSRHLGLARGSQPTSVREGLRQPQGRGRKAQAGPWPPQAQRATPSTGLPRRRRRPLPSPACAGPARSLEPRLWASQRRPGGRSS